MSLDLSREKRMRMRHLPKIGLVLLLFFVISSCSKVPMTGRKQLNLLPESDLMAMSLTSYNDFLSTNNVVKSGEAQTMVKRVGAKIAASVEDYLSKHRQGSRVKDFNWEFNLVDDPTVNAWCMPGGKVVFYTGILPICKDEEGLAVVMGHEIAHAIARHGNERMSQGLAIQFVGVAGNVALSQKSDTVRQIFNVAYGLGSQLGLVLPYSRMHESEADEMGIMFMAMAGYNPEGAPDFWDRMSAAGGARPLEFLSTHPDPSKRAAKLKEYMPKAMEYYKKAQAN
jgi:predicted Zn-dependent protease